MVFPYMAHDLAGLLENKSIDKLDPSVLKLYAKQLLDGTSYLHRVRLLCEFTAILSDEHRAEPHPTPRHESCQSADLRRGCPSDCRLWLSQVNRGLLR